MLKPFLVEMTDNADRRRRYTQVLVGHTPGDVGMDLDILMNERVWQDVTVTMIRQLDPAEYRAFVDRALQGGELAPTSVPPPPRTRPSRPSKAAANGKAPHRN
jgi:hypothetical protein